MKQLLLNIITVLLVSTSLSAQTWNWPEDPNQKVKAEEKNVLYSDALKANDFRTAANNLSWLLVNTPNLNPSIYIQGVKIYKGLEKAEKDPEKKKVFADSIMTLYDLRIANFNKKEKVLKRKSLDAFKYWIKRQEKYPELYEVMKEDFELNGDKIYDYNTFGYFKAAEAYKKKGGELSDDEFLELYFKISDVIDKKLGKKGAKVDKLNKYKKDIDNILVKTVEIDCDFVEENLVPKMNEDPSDIGIATKVFQLMLTGKCTDSPNFLTAAKILNGNEPTYGIAIVVAKKEAAAGNIEEAQKYYEQALELTDDNTKKAEIHYDLGNLYYSNGSYSKARTYAYKALQEDPTKKEAYNIVGNAYYGSFKKCKKGVSKVEDYATYIAAYEAYQKAGNTKSMNNAAQFFPTIEDIFNETKEVGQKITVGCWINETVTLRKRP